MVGLSVASMIAIIAIVVALNLEVCYKSEGCLSVDGQCNAGLTNYNTDIHGCLRSDRVPNHPVAVCQSLGASRGHCYDPSKVCLHDPSFRYSLPTRRWLWRRGADRCATTCTNVARGRLALL